MSDLDRSENDCLSRRNLLYLPSLLMIVVGLFGMLWFSLFPKPPAEDPLARVFYDHDRALLMASERQGEETRFITVLIPFDRTRFFINNGEPKGYEYELVRAFEQYLNERRRRGDPQIQAIYLPTRFSQLIPLLAEGIGDIAAGGLTVTPERAAQVVFGRPYMDDVAELVVSHVGAPPLAGLDDLAGRRFVVLRGSSYVESLQALNTSFVGRGLSPIDIVEAAPELQTEDLLEMTHAGIIDYTVADRHIADLWAGVLEGIHVHDDIAVAEGGAIAWAIRSGADTLKAEIDGFMDEVRRGTLIGNVIFNRYFDNVQFITNPLAADPLDDLVRYRDLFERHADEYGLDWRLVAAVAFQESRLDPNARSPRGAIGLMQLLPDTAAYVGVDDPKPVEANILAGVRYLAYLRDEVFADDVLDDQTRQHFMLAAYNAGPRRIRELRAMTEQQLGLDPNRWFFNVERAAQARIGNETVRYVTDVNKYWLAYQLGEAILAERRAERQAVN
jgi:membrane-bound lytic murein transglycosylase MltF